MIHLVPQYIQHNDFKMVLLNLISVFTKPFPARAAYQVGALPKVSIAYCIILNEQRMTSLSIIKNKSESSLIQSMHLNSPGTFYCYIYRSMSFINILIGLYI